MKKRFLIAAGMLVALGVQAAVIIDPGFERAYDSAGGSNKLTAAVNSQLYPSGANSTTPNVQDGYGWLAASGMRGNSNLDPVNNYWVILGAGPYNTPFTGSIGQINTDNKATKGLQQFEFTVAAWTVNNQAEDRVRFDVEVYGYIGLGNSIRLDSVNTPSTNTWTLIGAASTADIAGTGVYKTGDIDFGTGWDKVAFRLSPVDVNQTFGGGSDTLSISKIDVIPEPMTIGMLGMGALVAMLIRRIRS